MPYLSHNYRFQEKSKLKGLTEAFMFVAFSTLAIFVVLFVLGWFTAGGVKAATGINSQLNYQGKLNNSSGASVADGTYNIKLAIYDAATAGNCLWTAIGSCADGTIGTTTVAVVNGVFSITLGGTGQNSIATSTINWNSDALYLGVTIRGLSSSPVYDDEMSPRKRLTASAYAFNADKIDGINATSTAAVANYLMALDANKVLNLFDGSVSSTRATSTYLTVGEFGSETIYANGESGQVNIGTTTAATNQMAKLAIAKEGIAAIINGIYVDQNFLSSGTNSTSSAAFLRSYEPGLNQLDLLFGNKISANGNARYSFMEAWNGSGTNLFMLNSTGQLGLSTSTPESGYKLVVSGDSSFVGNIKVTGYASSTAGLFTKGSGHLGGSLTIDNELTVANTSTLSHVSLGEDSLTGQNQRIITINEGSTLANKPYVEYIPNFFSSSYSGWQWKNPNGKSAISAYSENNNAAVAATSANLNSSLLFALINSSNLTDGSAWLMEKKAEDDDRLRFYFNNYATSNGLEVLQLSTTGDMILAGDATTTGHLAASGGNSDQWNYAFSNIWTTTSERNFWNTTSTWTAFDSNWDRNYNATSTFASNFSIHGYASSTNLYSQGNGHLGGNLTVDGNNLTNGNATTSGHFYIGNPDVAGVLFDSEPYAPNPAYGNTIWLKSTGMADLPTGPVPSMGVDGSWVIRDVNDTNIANPVISFVSSSTVSMGSITMDNESQSLKFSNDTVSSSTITQNAFAFNVDVDQSDVAGYIASFINVTENSIGSGIHLLSQWSVGGSAKFDVDKAGKTRLGNLILDIANTGTGLLGISANESLMTLTSGKLAVGGDITASGYSTTSKNLYIPNIEEGTYDAVNVDANGRLTKVSSSRRYKSDIDYNGIDGSLAYQLQPVSYIENATGKELLGFIAEDVALVEPRLVIYDKEGRPDSLYYPNFTALLAQAIKDQKEEIDTLKVQVGSGFSDGSSLTVIDNPDIDVNTLVVRQAANFYGTILVKGEAGFEHRVTFYDDVEINGKIYASKDQAGTGMIAMGATSTEIIFEKEFSSTPKITATAKIPVALGIKDQTAKGFRAYVKEPAAEDLFFDWIVLAIKDSNPVMSEPESETAPIETGENIDLTATNQGLSDNELNSEESEANASTTSELNSTDNSTSTETGGSVPTEENSQNPLVATDS
ncbi:MAG: tail fiber domain-containing protein [Candidatus Buchananbacteria bacterium]